MKTILISVILLNIFIFSSLQNGFAQTPNGACTQTINLNAGWNLISLDVSPADKSIASVFGGLQVDNVELDVLTVEGTCINDDFRIPLNTGWNLIAYPPNEPQSPVEYFADLIEDENLIIVTGFNNGTKIFTPYSCGFVGCSLQQMENGFGYWIKIN